MTLPTSHAVSAALVAGINDDGEQAAGSEEGDGLINGGEGLLGLGDDGFVGAWQVAEVEEGGVDLSMNLLWQAVGEVFMACVEQRVAVRWHSGVDQALTSGLDGARLHIERPDMAGGGDLAAEKEGVMAVASGGIDGEIPGAKPVGMEQVRPSDGGGKAAAGTGEKGCGRWS